MFYVLDYLLDKEKTVFCPFPVANKGTLVHDCQPWYLLLLLLSFIADPLKLTRGALAGEPEACPYRIGREGCCPSGRKIILRV